MEKCSICCIGTSKDCYYDFGCEDFIFEDCLETDKKFFIDLEIITLYNFCPYCGHKNNLEKLRDFVPGILENNIISGHV